MKRDKSIRPKKDNKKEGVVGEKWDIMWKGGNEQNSIV